MKKKNGFISMTLVYTFLILFMFLMLAILRTYSEKNKYLQAINEQIDSDIGVAKSNRVTVINRLLEDNMPVSDANVQYFKVADSFHGNGNGLLFMDTRNTTGYNLQDITDSLTELTDSQLNMVKDFIGLVRNYKI